MEKKRIYQLARDFGLTPADVIERLDTGGMKIKASASASVDAKAAEAILSGANRAGAGAPTGTKSPAQHSPVSQEPPTASGAKKTKARVSSSSAISPAAGIASASEANKAGGSLKTPSPLATTSADVSPAGQETQTAPAPTHRRPVRPVMGQGGRRRVIIDSGASRRPAHPPLHGRERHQRKMQSSAATLLEAPEPQETPQAPPVTVPSGVTAKELSEKLDLTTAQVLKSLMTMGEMVSITSSLSDEAISLLGEELERTIEITHMEEEEPAPSYEDDPADLFSRPPVVTIMGHVDHGKTSLLDAVRETEVTKGEAGGITQHIGAYQVMHEGRKITFLDTPGHEAFTAMRARGAKVTDVAIIVVAADDGVMPQTVEAINHAKAAGVPMVIAVNKVDKPDANPEKIRQQMGTHGIVPEEWGGETVFVDVSAKQKLGLDNLLEMILLVAEVGEFKANPKATASGVIIESRLDTGRGNVATLLIDRGTLRVGDPIVAGLASGKVKAMYDFKGKRLKEAAPSMPVEILGFDSPPSAGEYCRVVESEREARTLALERSNRLRAEQISGRSAPVSLDDIFARIKEGEVRELNLIVKGDVAGSVEAIEESLHRLVHEEVRVRVIHRGVGAITESDITLAGASSAIVIGFNVRPGAAARLLAEQTGIDVRLYSVIYKVIDEVRAALTGMLTPDIVEEFLGQAEVRQIFRSSKLGLIAGSYITEGVLRRASSVRVVRDGTVVATTTVASVRRFQDDVREVSQGFECGILLDNFADLKEGDVLETFETKEVARTEAI